jgi:glycosyltransferase involved in cell wall biosynthesis
MLNNKSKFTIITITKDNAIGLRATLVSVAEQECKDFELIVIDGHSEDGTATVIDEFDIIVTKFVQDAGSGIYAAMNQGVSLASGEWIIFMNAGDCFIETRVLSKFTPQSSTDLAFGRAQKTNSTPHIPYRGLDKIWQNMPIPHQALFCRTELFRDRPFDVSFRIAGDFDFVMEQYENKKRFEYLDLDVAVVDGDGISELLLVKRVTEAYRCARQYFRWNFKMHFYYYRKLRWAHKEQRERANLLG